MSQEDERTDYVELSPEEIEELKRRIKDLDDPIRYVVYSQILPGDGMRFFLNIENGQYANDLEGGSIFKDYAVARAVADVSSKELRLLVAKITKDGNQLNIVKYDYRSDITPEIDSEESDSMDDLVELGDTLNDDSSCTLEGSEEDVATKKPILSDEGLEQYKNEGRD